MVIFSKEYSNVVYLFMRYLIMLSSIIPISMKTCLEFAKLYFTLKISRDKDIEGAIARNSNIPDELGRISFMLTDKTGTLTQNIMCFKKMVLINKSSTHVLSEDDSIFIKKAVQGEEFNFFSLHKHQKKLSYQHVVLEECVNKLIWGLAICHNVMTITEDNGEISYQASSPDEIALINFAKDFGIQLQSRTQSIMCLTKKNNSVENFEILNIFPFSSETKQMSIVVRHKESARIFYYVKGADNVISKMIKIAQKDIAIEESESLAREGLRTLVFAFKELCQDEYQSFKLSLESAQNFLDKKEKTISSAVSFLQTELNLLGITGVEDKLQNNVYESVENLRIAGIKIWMITGDKIDTAKCISLSTGLKSPTETFIEILNEKDEQKFLNQIENIETFGDCTSSVLLIDGVSLELAFKYKKKFLKIACACSGVICCRCAPTQKAQIVEIIKEYKKNEIVLAIGDGGNDVGMIQAADVGVGIVGKEGKQAALASDFSILEFKHVADLILWHGRLAYRKSALMAQFVIARGLTIAFMQTIFIFCFYFVSLPLYNGLLMIGYSSIFTLLPAYCLVYNTSKFFNFRFLT